MVKGLWSSIIRDEQGQGLPLALAALAMASLLSTPFLNQVRNGLLGGSVGQGIIEERYSIGAGVEHAIYRLKYEPNFAASLTPGSPSASYTVNINGRAVLVSLTRLFFTSSPPPGAPTPSGILVTKAVAPASAPAGETTTFTYTISLQNTLPQVVNIEELGDDLPSGFSYLPGSSQGITTANPAVSGQQIEWSFEAPYPQIEAGQTRTQRFQARATMEEGTYWNTAWGEFRPTSIGYVQSGPIAPVGATGDRYDIQAAAGDATLRANLRITSARTSLLSYQVK